jgi:heptosyltransferase-2
MRRFLIIQTAFIGDVILCTPIISELKRCHPNAKIDVVIRKGNEPLLENHPAVNQLFIWDKKTRKYGSLMNVVRSIRSYKYDEVINLQRYYSAAIMCLFSRSNDKTGFNKNKLPFMYSRLIEHTIGDGTHEVERNLKTIAHHSGTAQKIRPSIYPSDSDRQTVQSILKDSNPYFCMAPASVWETKKLPFLKWVELISNKSKEGFVYLLGGPQDKELCEKLKKTCSTKNIVNTSGQLTLLQSAALMQHAKMNYVNDSGPLHLASAVNAPTTAFFCSTIPRFGFGPLADESKVIEVDFDLSCRPCGLHGFRKCPKGHFKCGEYIKIKDAT